MKLMHRNRIETIRARAAAEFDLYHLSGNHGQYEVTRKGTARAYSVDLPARSCNCPAFVKESYCKHCAMCQLEEETRLIDTLATEYRELQAGREEMESARLDRLEATAPRISFPVKTFAQYSAAANLPNLSAYEREQLCYDFDRLYKRTI